MFPRAICSRVLRSFTMMQTPKDVAHLHEKMDEVLMLKKLVKELPKGKSKMESEISSHGSSRLHASLNGFCCKILPSHVKFRGE